MRSLSSQSHCTSGRALFERLDEIRGTRANSSMADFARIFCEPPGMNRLCRVRQMIRSYEAPGFAVSERTAAIRRGGVP